MLIFVPWYFTPQSLLNQLRVWKGSEDIHSPFWKLPISQIVRMVLIVVWVLPLAQLHLYLGSARRILSSELGLSSDERVVLKKGNTDLLTQWSGHIIWSYCFPFPSVTWKCLNGSCECVDANEIYPDGCQSCHKSVVITFNILSIVHECAD
jgi:hypothetical protein